MPDATETGNAAQATPAPSAAPDKSWAGMSMNERLVFLAKLCIMICSGGFIFANLLADDIPPADSAG